MKDSTKKLLKILAIPFLLFLTYPIALGFKIFYALETHQPEIEGDHYTINMDYDQFLKNENTKNRSLKSPILQEEDGELQINAGFLKQGSNEIPFQYESKEDQSPVEGGSVEIRLSRPATTNQDQIFQCKTDSAGKCSIQVPLNATGSWDLLLQASDPGGKFTRFQRIEVPAP